MKPTFLQALKEELHSDEMQRCIRAELEAQDPLRQVAAWHGPDWMDEEQADWEGNEA